MPIGDTKFRNLLILLLCLALYRYLSRKSKRDIMSSANKQTFMETIRSISFEKVKNETVEYCTDFCKRRPIMASLIALELGSWTYLGLRKFAKSFIWWNTVLELEISGDYTLKPKDPLDELLTPPAKKRLSFLELIHTIHGAARDRRVRALFIRIESEFIIGMGQCEELRNTLLSFKEKGNKPIIVYADNIATWGMNGVRHYYIASVATTLLMSEDGIIHLGPATSDYPFLKSGLKDKLDITVEVRRRAQYKAFGNMFVRDEFDEFHKEQTQQLLRHFEKNFIDAIAKSRVLKPYSIPRDVQIIHTIKWMAQQIVNENAHLEFKLQNVNKEAAAQLLSNIKEEKSSELEENYSGSGDKYEDEWKEELMYLVHCWSWDTGDYKHPILFVVLQFYDKDKRQNVYYQATVTHPAKRLGKLQRGAQVDTEATTDSDGNEIIKELKYEILDAFEPKPYCIELVKPGDIEPPIEDKQLDEDQGRADIRASLPEQHVVIRRNVNDILHHGYYSSREALTLGLIDGTTSYSDIYKEIIPRILHLEEKKVSYLYVHRYYQRVYKSKLSKGIPNIPNTAEDPSAFNIMKYIHPSSTKIAYVAATNGQIIDGESNKDRIGSTTVCRMLRAARKKKDIKGVILHLDTPGGMATACHNMCCEIKALINESKPVIAVQSNIAASGGYYLSAPCSYIISSPSTITGSIGVIGLKLRTKEFWKNKLGINYDRVSTNPLNASQFSHLEGFGEFERIRMEKAINDWYKLFKNVIAAPRDMELEKLETVAKGQVWLGSQALEIGLVDELGGLYEAMTKMKELLNIASYKKIDLVNPLGKIKIWDILMGRTPENENDFSVPRNAMQWLNPMAWLKHSGCVNLVLLNIISSPMISTVWSTCYGAATKDVNTASLMGSNTIINDLRFMADQIKFYQNNAVSMHSVHADYFNHSVLRKGQI